jgi:hypothetical protein
MVWFIQRIYFFLFRREIQFSGLISSVLFANKRGDLLVGLKDHISVTAMQNYFPIYLMRAALTHTFLDDIVEDPLVFDSHVDFWGYCYEEQKQLYNSPIRWHVPKGHQLIQTQAPFQKVWQRVDPIDYEAAKIVGFRKSSNVLLLSNRFHRDEIGDYSSRKKLLHLTKLQNSTTNIPYQSTMLPMLEEIY